MCNVLFVCLFFAERVLHVWEYVSINPPIYRWLQKQVDDPMQGISILYHIPKKESCNLRTEKNVAMCHFDFQ